MTDSLDYVWTHRSAVFVLLVAAFGVVGMVQWLAWIFRRGRFRVEPGQTQLARGATNSLGYVAANFFVEIINDFRHLLALVIVGVFAVALGVAMYPGFRQWNVEEIGKGVEAVAAALGGLIGSIIGYYFGESAATQRAGISRTRDTAPVQASPVTQTPIAVQQAPPPPAGRTEPPAPAP
jgi:hypothetical protein